MSHTVLIVEDDETLADNIRCYLERARWQVEVCHSAEAALKRVPALGPTVVLSDFGLPGMNGRELLTRTAQIDPNIKFIMMTGSGDVQNAVAAMKAGAFDYLSKPVALADIRALLDRALVAAGRPASSAPAAEPANDSGTSQLDRIIGSCAEMQRMKATVRQLLEAERHMPGRDLPVVLINGETGTGKELVARALHYDGTRSTGPFIEINCASIPPHLLEAELFGYEKGAFTDARERKIGVVEAADGGTLFLDEIGEIDLALQAKLLKLLEDKSIRRIGAVREQPVDLRIVSATNRDLEQRVREGLFRSDLFFRLRIISIRMPPLRARGDDILALARFYLGQLGRRYGKPDLDFSAEAERSLLAYAWPGNVRELRNMLEQAVLLTHQQLIGPELLQQCEQLGGTPRRRATDQPAASVSLPHRNADLTPDETDLLLVALRQTDWNITKAAKKLGLTRDMLRYRIDKLGLARPE